MDLILLPFLMSVPSMLMLGLFGVMIALPLDRGPLWRRAARGFSVGAVFGSMPLLIFVWVPFLPWIDRKLFRSPDRAGCDGHDASPVEQPLPPGSRALAALRIVAMEVALFGLLVAVLGALD